MDDVWGISLRRVGYGIPTEYLPTFTSSAIDVVAAACADPLTVQAVRHALGLLVKSLVCTILEGSAVVTRAINVNTVRAMKDALV